MLYMPIEIALILIISGKKVRIRTKIFILDTRGSRVYLIAGEAARRSPRPLLPGLPARPPGPGSRPGRREFGSHRPKGKGHKLTYFTFIQ